MNDSVNAILLTTYNGMLLLPSVAVAEIIPYIKPINNSILWRDINITLDYYNKDNEKYIAVLYNHKSFIGKALIDLPKIINIKNDDLSDLDDKTAKLGDIIVVVGC